MKVKTDEKGLQFFMEKIIPGLFFVTFLLLILYPVHDPDVFWHLKTGEWIWQHKELPARDPFSVTVDPSIYNEPARPNAILKGYWLSQLTIYALYNLFGLYGIIIFRCLVYFGVISLLYCWMRRKGVIPIVTLFFLIPGFLVIQGFGGERPNTLSYLMALCVFYILNEHLEQRGRRLLHLPLLMWLWSFMHGGFILGEVITGLFLLRPLYRIIVGSPSRREEIFKVAICLASMLAPLLNRVAWDAPMQQMKMKGSLYAQSIIENASPFTLVRVGDYGSLVLLGFMAFLIIVVIRRFSAEQLLCGAFILGLSLCAIRYIPFFILLMTPIAAGYWTERPLFRLEGTASRRFAFAMYSTLLFSAIFMGQSALRNSAMVKGPLSIGYPADGVEFLRGVHAKGNIFNDYDWGGYLIYGLSPEMKVFIDGRGLSLLAFEKYTAVMRAAPDSARGGDPEWSKILDDFRIRIIFLPICNKQRERFLRINKILLEERQWVPVFIGKRNRDVIFARRGSENEELIKRYAIPKNRVYEEALEIMERDPARRTWRQNLEAGLINVYLGRYADAEMHFERALEQNQRLTTSALPLALEKIRKRETRIFERKELEELQTL